MDNEAVFNDSFRCFGICFDIGRLIFKCDALVLYLIYDNERTEIFHLAVIIEEYLDGCKSGYLSCFDRGSLCGCSGSGGLSCGRSRCGSGCSLSCFAVLECCGICFDIAHQLGEVGRRIFVLLNEVDLSLQQVRSFENEVVKRLNIGDNGVFLSDYEEHILDSMGELRHIVKSHHSG